MPADAMPEVYGGADIVLDQFPLGTYGVAACEALVAGRLVVSHVSDVHAERCVNAPAWTCRSSKPAPIDSNRCFAMRGRVASMLARSQPPVRRSCEDPRRATLGRGAAAHSSAPRLRFRSARAWETSRMSNRHRDRTPRA